MLNHNNTIYIEDAVGYLNLKNINILSFQTIKWN